MFSIAGPERGGGQHWRGAEEDVAGGGHHLQYEVEQETRSQVSLFIFLIWNFTVCLYSISENATT